MMEVAPEYGKTFMDCFEHLPPEKALKIASKFIGDYQTDLSGNQKLPEPVFPGPKHTNGAKTNKQKAREKVVGDHNQTNFEIEPKDIPEDQSNH